MTRVPRALNGSDFTLISTRNGLSAPGESNSASCEVANTARAHEQAGKAIGIGAADTINQPVSGHIGRNRASQFDRANLHRFCGKFVSLAVQRVDNRPHEIVVRHAAQRAVKDLRAAIAAVAECQRSLKTRHFRSANRSGESP